MFLEFICRFFSYVYVFFLCFLQFPLTLAYPEVFQVGDKVNILDPYDGTIADNRRIQSLSMIHGVPLGLEDANANVINVQVTSPFPVKIKLMDVNV